MYLSHNNIIIFALEDAICSPRRILTFLSVRVLACLVAACLDSASHIEGSPLLNELRPSVCQNQVLDA